jgi:hypothetical protein
MPCMRLNARLETSRQGPRHPFKDVGVVADRLTGINIAVEKCLFVVNSSCICKDF